ncbi:MAG: hypothetical protein L6R39_001102, partial [Caloplaca ligustica]
MTMAQVVYTGVTDAEGIEGTLFRGTKFWLSQKVPQRKRFIDESNGGEVTPLEKEADVKIVDHARKEQLPGTYSYTYVEQSVRNRALEDLERHAVGPPVGSLRTVGSAIQPPRSGRTPFTTEDDRFLVNWVVGSEQSGGATGGNEIYKQLEAKNPRHTWQSWRDRWVKNLRTLPRSAFISQNAPPTPPAEQSVGMQEPLKPATPLKARPKAFSKEDGEDLMMSGEGIMNMHPDNVEDAWSAWAESRENPKDHSAREWQDFWEKSIRPVFLKHQASSTSSPPEVQVAAEPDTEGKDQSEQLKPVPLPVRTSPAKDSEAHNKSRSPSYHPESPTDYSKGVGSAMVSPSYHPESPTDYSKGAGGDGVSVDSVAISADGAGDTGPIIGSPFKRKRSPSEEVEEVPSSSPPDML